MYGIRGKDWGGVRCDERGRGGIGRKIKGYEREVGWDWIDLEFVRRLDER